MAAALVEAHGLTTGLFTSPHLHRVEERYEVGGAAMTPEEFGVAMATLAPIVEFFEQRSGEGVTYFELTAALAYSWFAERAVEVGVIETGLGGRLDATRAAPGEVSVVTTIGLEHTEYLGDTIPEIAAEKMAILPDGGILVTGRLDPEAAAVAERTVSERGASWLRLGHDLRVGGESPIATGWSLDVEAPHAAYPGLVLGVHGRHQLDNLAVAIGSVEALLGRPLDRDAVRRAAATVTCPGRMEVVLRDPVLMVDGAHNPPGTAALVAALAEEFSGIRWQVVFGAMADKDVAAMLEALRPVIAGIHAVGAATGRAIPASEMAAMASTVLGPGFPVTVAGGVADGVRAATASGGPVLVTGSLYVVGEARVALGLA